MRLLATMVFVLFAACGGDSRNPSIGGGGGGGGGTGGRGPDAGRGAGSDGSMGFAISGFSCAIGDLRTPGICADNPAGIRVDERGSAATTITGVGGQYVLPIEPRTNVVIDVATDSVEYRPGALRISLGAEGAAGVVLPIISEANFQSLQTELDTTSADGSATVAVYLRNNNTPIVGATIEVPPAGTLGGVYYDQPGTPSYTLVQNGTGASGAAVMFGVPSGLGDIALTIADAGAANIVDLSGIPVAPNGLTLVFFDFASLGL